MLIYSCFVRRLDNKITAAVPEGGLPSGAMQQGHEVMEHRGGSRNLFWGGQTKVES